MKTKKKNGLIACDRLEQQHWLMRANHLVTSLQQFVRWYKERECYLHMAGKLRLPQQAQLLKHSPSFRPFKTNRWRQWNFTDKLRSTSTILYRWYSAYFALKQLLGAESIASGKYSHTEFYQRVIVIQMKGITRNRKLCFCSCVLIHFLGIAILRYPNATSRSAQQSNAFALSTSKMKSCIK